MAIIRLLLEIYIAMTLGIAGIAKLDAPSSFASFLHETHFPKWSIVIVSKAFPWFEIIISLAILMMPNEYKRSISLLLPFLFLVFFCINFWMIRKKSSAKRCSCYGQALKQEDLGVKVVASFIQLLLVVYLIFLIQKSMPASNVFYFSASIVVCCLFVWLLLRTWKRQRWKNRYSPPSVSSQHLFDAKQVLPL